MKKVALLFTMAIMLMACDGGSKSSDVTCELDYGSSGIVESVITSYDGDKKIEKIVITKQASIPEYLFEEHDVKELEELFKNEYINPNKKQEGLKFDISVDKKDKKLSVKVEIDPKKASEADIQELGIEEYKDAEKLVKTLKSEKFSCGKVE